MTERERYGRSPVMDALADMRAWNDLPPDERVKASAQFVRELYGMDASVGEQAQKDEA